MRLHRADGLLHNAFHKRPASDTFIDEPLKVATSMKSVSNDINVLALAATSYNCCQVLPT